jgi:hypothetical protein
VRERRTKPVRLETDIDSKIVVIVKTSKRNKDGRVEYATEESFNVLDATAAEVIDVVSVALGGKKRTK